jgi:hypothetical protein
MKGKNKEGRKESIEESSRPLRLIFMNFKTK